MSRDRSYESHGGNIYSVWSDHRQRRVYRYQKKWFNPERLAEASVQVARLRVRQRRSRSSVLEMVLTEGRNREIRRMAARIGHKVMSLKRIAFGPLRLGQLPPGAYRELTRDELKSLRAFVRRPSNQVAANTETTGSTDGRPSRGNKLSGGSRSRRHGSRTSRSEVPRSARRRDQRKPKPKPKPKGPRR